MKPVRTTSGSTGASPSADDILRAIRRIVHVITIHSKHLYRQTGLTVPQLWCLRAIANAEQTDVTAADVSRSVGISPATVTGIGDRLERSGLVRRERRSKDRRKIGLALTEKGEASLCTKSLHERFTTRIMTMDEPSRQFVLDTLESVVDMIDVSSLDAAPIRVPHDLSKQTMES